MAKRRLLKPGGKITYRGYLIRERFGRFDVRPPKGVFGGGGWTVDSIKEAKRSIEDDVRSNPPRKNWKSGKWIKATAVRVRKEAGRLVMDIKR